MGVIERIFGVIFGNNRNVVRETVEIFRENAEEGAVRSAKVQEQAMGQYTEEFRAPQAGSFDRFMDGVNRLPRPAMALGTLGLFISAMVAPLWFAQRMQGIALVPEDRRIIQGLSVEENIDLAQIAPPIGWSKEPLWWLLGVIVSFYFGARNQVKSQDFQRSIVSTIKHVPQVVENIDMIGKMRAQTPGAADPGTDVRLGAQALKTDDNPALQDWRAAQ